VLEVPLSVPEIGPDEIAAVTAVLERRWLTMGPETESFEREFAALVGAEHATAVSNCTTALHLALLAVGVKPGEEVLVPTLSFVATANAVRYCGATPVFVESASENDLNLCLEDAAKKITPKTRGIIAVHHSGYAADLMALRAFAKAHGLFYIEDAAQSAGAARDGIPCGASGDLACFSFYSTKNATTAEGGMVTTRNAELAAKVKLLRSHGMTASVVDRDRGKAFGYDVVALGYNYRIDELRAALGRVQLRKLLDGNRRRGEWTARYRRGLTGVPGLVMPFAGAPGESAHHLFPVLLPEGTDRVAFAAELRARGIQSSVHYTPIHLMTYYRETQGTKEGMLPRTEAISRRELTLPLYPSLTEEQVDHVIEVVRGGLGAGRS
jgi:dTDP-4-amino-4,6-dideoxygalactose transaminase